MIVGIDSMVLIYAGLVPKKSKKIDAKQAELTKRSKLLLHMLRDETVVLPTVAIAEILAPVRAENRGLLIKKLESLFLCPAFDLAASSIAAQLWAKHKGLGNKDPYNSKRQVLRSDAMIIASAKAAGATQFYTNDKKCRTLASLVMTGHELPTRDPTDMFAADDIANGDL